MQLPTNPAVNYFLSNGYGSHQKSVQEKMKYLTDKLLRQTKKLVLVLDIDHTLLHTTKNSHASVAFKNKEISEDIYIFNLLTQPAGIRITYYVKLRPGLAEFLDCLKNYYYIVLYTKGLKVYAHKVLSIIDPTGSLISQRVVCREDQPNVNDLKTITTLFPCDEKSVLIIDDRVNVWQNVQNVYQCHKFHFWPADHATTDDPDYILDEYIEKQNDMLSPGEKPLDEKFSVDLLAQRNKDNILKTISNVLRAIHCLYYQTSQKFVKNIPCDARKLLVKLRRQVLRGIHIVFSGLFPVDSPKEEQLVWRIAEEYGARCSVSIDSSVTHLIARKLNTEKTNMALSLKRIPIVSLAWLYDCIVHFRRVSEKRFLLKNSANSVYVRSFSAKIITVKTIIDPFKIKPVTIMSSSNLKSKGKTKDYIVDKSEGMKGLIRKNKEKTKRKKEKEKIDKEIISSIRQKIIESLMKKVNKHQTEFNGNKTKLFNYKSRENFPKINIKNPTKISSTSDENNLSKKSDNNYILSSLKEPDKSIKTNPINMFSGQKMEINSIWHEKRPIDPRKPQLFRKPTAKKHKSAPAHAQTNKNIEIIRPRLIKTNDNKNPNRKNKPPKKKKNSAKIQPNLHKNENRPKSLVLKRNHNFQAQRSHRLPFKLKFPSTIKKLTKFIESKNTINPNCKEDHQKNFTNLREKQQLNQNRYQNAAEKEHEKSLEKNKLIELYSLPYLNDKNYKSDLNITPPNVHYSNRPDRIVPKLPKTRQKFDKIIHPPVTRKTMIYNRNFLPANTPNFGLNRPFADDFPLSERNSPQSIYRNDRSSVRDFGIFRRFEMQPLPMTDNPVVRRNDISSLSFRRGNFNTQSFPPVMNPNRGYVGFKPLHFPRLGNINQLRSSRPNISSFNGSNRSHVLPIMTEPINSLNNQSIQSNKPFVEFLKPEGQNRKENKIKNSYITTQHIKRKDEVNNKKGKLNNQPFHKKRKKPGQDGFDSLLSEHLGGQNTSKNEKVSGSDVKLRKKTNQRNPPVIIVTKDKDNQPEEGEFVESDITEI